MISSLRVFIVGLLMGSADVVPGVSGGTIALIAGVYERLLGSLKSGSSALGALIRADFAAVRGHLGEVEWGFLALILSGILVAVLSLAHFIDVQLETRPIVLAAAFFGLVLGSVFIGFGLIRVFRNSHVVIAAIVGAAMFIVLGFGSSATLGEAPLVAFFGAGALAICAMILPGISGSLILLMIGMYQLVLAAVNDREVLSVVVFASGAVVGLAFFTQLLQYALGRWHDIVLAVLIGLMIGSLRILWPWPDGVDGPVLGAPGASLAAASIAAIVGFGAVLLIARLGRPNDL